MVLAMVLASASVRAEAPKEKWQLWGQLSLGSMLQEDQRKGLGFDSLGFGGAIGFDLSVTQWIAPSVRLRTTAFEASDVEPPTGVPPASMGRGGVIQIGVGAQGRLVLGNRFLIQPYAYIDLGVTGDKVRPAFELGLSSSFKLTPKLSMGPAVSYQHIFQTATGSVSSDGNFVLASLKVAYHSVPPSPQSKVSKPSKRVPPDPPPLIEDVLVPRPETPSSAESPPIGEEVESLLSEFVFKTTPVELLPAVVFPLDSSTPLACGSVALFEALERIKKMPPSWKVVVEGHADRIGSTSHNEALALERAEAVAGWLADHGVAKERIEVASFGEQTPLESRPPGANTSLDRRVRFRLVPPKLGEEQRP